MAIFDSPPEPPVSTISKFNNSSFSGIIKPGEKLQLPQNRFHNKKIIITNTGKSILHIYRAYSINDIIPLKSVVFYPGEVRKIMPKDIGESDTNTTIIFNPDINQEGGFAMSYI